MGIKRFLAKQARQPSGWFGKLIIGKIFNRANQELEDWGFRLMPIKPDTHYLEIGFGNGRLISKVGQVISNGKIGGVDISEEMLKQAIKRNKVLQEKGILDLRLASVNSIPFRDQRFDVIFSANSIYFWPEVSESLVEVRRVLKENGFFYCGFQTRSELIKMNAIKENRDVFKNLFEKDEIIPLFEKAGFSNLSMEQNNSRYGTDSIIIAKR